MTHPTRWTPPEWPDAPMVECAECDGRMMVNVEVHDERGFRHEAITCPVCHGVGEVPDITDAPDRETRGDEKYHQAVDDDAERGGRK